MVAIKQCVICNAWECPPSVLDDLWMAGLVKREPCLCDECRTKILTILDKYAGTENKK